MCVSENRLWTGFFFCISLQWMCNFRHVNIFLYTGALHHSFHVETEACLRRNFYSLISNQLCSGIVLCWIMSKSHKWILSIKPCRLHFLTRAGKMRDLSFRLIWCTYRCETCGEEHQKDHVLSLFQINKSRNNRRHVGQIS